MFWQLHSKKVQGDAIALYEYASDRFLTYAELGEQCTNLSEVFNSVSPKEKVLTFVFTESRILPIATYLACMQSAHAAYLADSRLTDVRKQELVERYKPGFICCYESNGYPGYEVVFQDEDFVISRRVESPHYTIHPDLAVLLSTSGSTGSPKFVRLSYQNLQSNAEAIAQYLGMNESDRAITTLPVHYAYGLSVVNSHLACGGSLVCTDEAIVSRAFWDLFRKHQCTSIAGVPFIYQLLHRLKFHEMELNSLRTMTQAGGALNPQLIRYFHESCEAKNCRFFVMYGQTEATARMSYVPPETLGEKIGSIGIAIPGGNLSLRVSDELAETCADKQATGELVYSGPNVMMGYAQTTEDLAKGDELQGELLTGDIARRDEDGFYYIVGRKKRFIKLLGHRVSLDHIEQVLLDKFGNGIVCLGRDDRLIVIYERAQEGLEANAVKRYAAASLRVHARLVDVIQIEQIPRNSSGKIDRHALQMEVVEYGH